MRGFAFDRAGRLVDGQDILEIAVKQDETLHVRVTIGPDPNARAAPGGPWKGR